MSAVGFGRPDDEPGMVPPAIRERCRQDAVRSATAR